MPNFRSRKIKISAVTLFVALLGVGLIAFQQSNATGSESEADHIPIPGFAKPWPTNCTGQQFCQETALRGTTKLDCDPSAANKLNIYIDVKTPAAGTPITKYFSIVCASDAEITQKYGGKGYFEECRSAVSGTNYFRDQKESECSGGDTVVGCPTGFKVNTTHNACWPDVASPPPSPSPRPAVPDCQFRAEPAAAIQRCQRAA